MKKTRKHNKSLNKKKRNYLPLLWRYVVAFTTGLATMFSILSYVHPNIVVTPLAPIDPARIFSTQFVVSNNGYLTIHDIKYECAIEKIEGQVTFGSYGGLSGINEISPRLSALEHDLKSSLGPNHSDTVSFDFRLFTKAEPIRSADVGIVVSFRVGFIPLRQEHIYHFVTQRSSDGRLHWVPKPLDKEP